MTKMPWCRLALVAAFLAVATAGLVASQEPAPPKPGPEHEAMGYFLGTWSFEGEAKPGPMGPGGRIAFTERCEWFDGGFALVCRSEGEGPMGPMRSLAIMSYDAAADGYAYYAVESGMPPFLARGRREGKSWQWKTESKMGAATVTTRVTVTEASPTEYTFSMKVSTDGGASWTDVMEGRSKKTTS